MPLSKFDGLELPASADFHVHLRDGHLKNAVIPTIRQGGVNTVYVSNVQFLGMVPLSSCLLRLEEVESGTEFPYDFLLLPDRVSAF